MQHVRLFVTVLAIVSLGVISLTKLPVNLLPSIDQPSLLVRTEWPGASAREIEEAVTEQLEAVLGTLPGLESVSSITR